jgi:DNA-binding winged helix-turn-helix (wHTH) protein/TolB-like protein
VARLRFGLFDFDLHTRELQREGVLVRLQAQPAQVLAVLLEHAGGIVTREELRQAVWGDDTHVDFSQGLNYCIAQIRTALGDSADSPRFVRTIPKQGYQFIAPILATPEPAPPRNSARRSRIRRWALALAFILMIGGILGVMLWHPKPPIIAVARFDNETGLAAMTAFSDALTDMVVVRLTADAGAKFGIIGNAEPLRQPRPYRDLLAIGSSLKAKYLILGQVQGSAAHRRVLAHLVRLPDQTHVAVARFDRAAGDDLQTETELSRLIAANFLQHLH